MAHSHFSISYTAHGYAISLFPSFFKPIYILKAHLFISWACDPLFLPLGLMILPPICQPFAALVVELSSFYLDSQKWLSTFSPLNIWNVPAVHMWIKNRPVFPTSFLSFPSMTFLNSGPLFIYIFFFSCREQCCLFEFPSLAVMLKHICCLINFIPILMVGPLPSFVSALMTWVFKEESLRVSNTNSFFSKKHTLSVPLSSSFSFSQTLTPIYFDQALILWRRWKAKAPPTVKGRGHFRSSRRTWCRWGGRVFWVRTLGWGWSTMRPQQWMHPFNRSVIWCPPSLPKDSQRLCAAVARPCMACP